MSHRDPELERLDAELRAKLQSTKEPYIERPEHVAISDGSTCWLDQGRECNADCRAYDSGVQPPEGPAVCTVLSSMMIAAENIEGFVHASELFKKAAQDRARVTAASAAVPDPTGRRGT